jgi:UDPglucose--hexose-1-phosphate uridylyltransferase
MGGFGVHEAIIDTPDHSHSIAQMSDAHVANVLRVDKSRYDALSLDHRIAHVTIYYDEYGECMFCQSREEEIADGQRVLLLTEHFVALEPYACPTPF